MAAIATLLPSLPSGGHASCSNSVAAEHDGEANSCFVSRRARTTRFVALRSTNSTASSSSSSSSYLSSSTSLSPKALVSCRDSLRLRPSCQSESVSWTSRQGLGTDFIDIDRVKSGTSNNRRQRSIARARDSGVVRVTVVASAEEEAKVIAPEDVLIDDNEQRQEQERVGVLLLNLGGPDTLEDVQPFLFNLFADPDIIRLPRLFRFLQRPLATFISTLRAPKSAEGYAAIGGGSPLRQMTNEQAEALKAALKTKNLPAKVYVGMRYWHPFTEEAISQIKEDGITRLVVLPLYPQFSISTSGSSLRLLESIFRQDEYLVNMQHTVIPSWYNRNGYVQSMATLIQKELAKFEKPEEVHIFFSAHGVPVAYVEEAGDPYKAEMEECVQLIMSAVKSRGIRCPHTLAYQSRVGPVEWLKPYTDVTIRELGQDGVKSLLAVPVSFVSEHIETLEEIDMEYRELALESGIRNWGRVPALGVEPGFIADLADAIIEALPYVGAMAVSNLEARQSLVPLGSVEQLLATYDTLRRELPAPVSMWQWGWTKSAETWNGRAAMLAVLTLLVLEITSGQGVLHQFGLLPLFH